MLDFDLATKTTGSRFVFVKDKLAHLERALSNFKLDTHYFLGDFHKFNKRKGVYSSTPITLVNQGGRTI